MLLLRKLLQILQEIYGVRKGDGEVEDVEEEVGFLIQRGGRMLKPLYPPRQGYVHTCGVGIESQGKESKRT